MENCRLIYRSTCRDGFIDNAQLRDLIAKSADNNRAAGITGMLILSGDQFLQVLEGPADAVNRLYAYIMADRRHKDLRLISYESIAERHFDDWGMSLVDLYDLPKPARDLLERKYSVRDGAILIPERLHEVYALLLDARFLCQGRPWEDGAD
ncbi:BLUF domain-containing protein [Thiorhodococcus fuscus]|uniref:BLUF domain-containing protein n=1 Tax=Thiorhodococcus fuscus TaxID=527200 RepID=A0ABW4YC03_9GAMM